MRTVVVTAERSGKWWVLESPEAGAVSQSRTLAGADAEMREAIAFQLGLPADGFTIDLRVLPPPAAKAALENAALLEREAELKASAARASRRQAARDLAAADLTVRDIGRVMGISHQRAHQLLNP
jgi:predicted RNase H-like HicB family nuclease